MPVKTAAMERFMADRDAEMKEMLEIVRANQAKPLQLRTYKNVKQRLP